jgi:hypothetical protein
MKKKLVLTIVLLVCSVAFILFIANRPKKKSVTVISLKKSELIICDESLVEDEKDLNLSELVEDLQIIHLDNRDEAFTKCEWMYFSENYFCIRGGNVVKLFEKSGKYLCDVGSKGNGPGEYRFPYDILIDEADRSIYVSDIIGEYILKYNMKGAFVRKISFGERLNKPRIFLNTDSTFSLAHLCFKDMDNQFVAANIQLHNNDSIKYTYVEELTSNFKNKAGQKVGIENEIWSYRNTPNFPFAMTHTDTLYHYNSIKNEISARFTMKIDKEKKGVRFIILNELPHHYLIVIVGGKGGRILVNKKTHEASYVNITNDSLGNMSTSLKFQDGYSFAMYEPTALREKIVEHLQSGDCPDDKINRLEKLRDRLKGNDNNVLILGKLK